MPRLTRRSFVKTGLSSAAGMTLVPHLAAAGPRDETFPYRIVGRVRPVPSSKIQASPLSVGFEVLDRKRFDPVRTYPHLAELGVKWARCQTGWNRCERTRGEFTFDWLDEVVDSLLKIGIQPWFNLGYGNKIYTPEKPDDYSVGWAPVFDDDARTGWLRFVDRLAEHFGGRVRHWEIWNEPNITGFWKPKKPNPGDYAEMVRITSPAIRKRVRGAVIIGGAYAGIPISYIKGCLENGMAEFVDKISYHPYRPVPESGYEDQIAALRELIGGYRKGIKLWQGENGCPSKGGEGSVGALSNLDWDETCQAKWLLRRILIDLRLGVELTSYFHTVDLVGYRGKTNFKGLLRGTDYTPKPAYSAYQNLCALFDSNTKRVESGIELGGKQEAQVETASFARNGRALYAWWTPASLQKGWTAGKVSFRLQSASSPPAGFMVDSVLIDPLSGSVFRIRPTWMTGSSFHFENAPLLDYPLIITDRRVVTEA